MEEGKRKVMDATEQEIARIFEGREKECIGWLGATGAALTSTMGACEKLMELAQQQGWPFDDKTKMQVSFLSWYGTLVISVASQIDSLGRAIVSPIGEMLPDDLFEALAGMYLAANRAACALWRDREETRLLWKDVPTSVN